MEVIFIFIVDLIAHEVYINLLRVITHWLYRLFILFDCNRSGFYRYVIYSFVIWWLIIHHLELFVKLSYEFLLILLIILKIDVMNLCLTSIFLIPIIFLFIWLSLNSVLYLLQPLLSHSLLSSFPSLFFLFLYFLYPDLLHPKWYSS